MDFVVREILDINAECCRIASDLSTCLKEERTALIQLKTEHLVEANFRKEHLCGKLTKRKRELRILLKERYGSEKLSEVILEKSDPFLESAQTWQAEWKNIENLMGFSAIAEEQL